MNPEIQRLFEAALDIPETNRTGFVQSQTNDPEIRREVLSLLLHDKPAEQFFEATIRGEASSLVSSLDWTAGRTIGKYRILSMLGRGGMGTVYLAERADGTFKQRVALKVIQSAIPAGFLLDRFQQERQILAQLSHPYIAGLFDGGQTEDGLPYFVMEYVAGQSIDTYCDRLQLSIAGRMKLFLKVCEAVQYAHQNLIVHRDLKPANILVNAEGQPKLLDFGMAKALDPAESGSNQPSTRVLTPEFASPEQIRGDRITTSTDIYSLGAVLYALLSGRPPRAIGNLSALKAAQEIAAADFFPIESAPTDVNAVLRKALHPDAPRRYRSVGEFSGDITRYLENRPVLARPDSLGYRATKFLRRNWVAAAAITGVISALGTGAGIATWQARRAERQFSNVRRLANTFLFDFENAIHNVSGTTKARLLVVNTGTEYLNRLEAEAGGDRQLLRELADAYKKLGDVQGNLTGGNLGMFQQAAQSYKKGLALRDRLGDTHSSDPKIQANYLNNLVALASLERFAGEATTGDRLRAIEIELADRWAGSSTADADLLSAAAFAYSDLSHTQRLREEFASAAVNARKNLDLLKRACELEPANWARVRTLASSYVGAGYVELDAGRYGEAIDQFSQGNRLLDAPLMAVPKDPALRRQRMVLLEKIGEATGRLRAKENGARSDALPFFETASRIGNELVAEDPVDEGIQTDFAGLCQLYGSSLVLQRRPADGLPLLRRAVEIYARQWNNVPEDTNAAFNLAVTRVWTSDCRRDLGDLQGALEETSKAGQIWDRLLTLRPGTFRYLHQKADNLNTMGNLLAREGDVDGARKCFREGLEIAENLPAQDAAYSTAVVVRELRDSEKKLVRIRNH
jgi:serine/threonine protein kinase/tetratricopeptide (TPR) repeat protein